MSTFIIRLDITFASRFTSKQNMRNPDLAPIGNRLLNPVSLQVFDDMFFRLPFPDIQRMDKLLERKQVVGEIAQFLKDMRSDFEDPRVMTDFRDGWMAFLQIEKGGSLHEKNSLSKSKARMRKRESPTASDIEELHKEEDNEVIAIYSCFIFSSKLEPAYVGTSRVITVTAAA